MAKQKTELIKEMMENYPEAGSGMSLRCTGWNYGSMEFTFLDVEEDKKYEINMEMLKKGLDILLKIILDGKYFNAGRTPNLLAESYDHDAWDSDALVQCAIFGEVLYG